MSEIPFEAGKGPQQELVYEVSIYLKGDELLPSVIEEQIGIRPTEAQIKGGLAAGSSKFVAKTGMWLLVANTKSTMINDHFDTLLTQLENIPCALTELSGVEEAYLDVLILAGTLQEARQLMSFEIPLKHIALIARLGLNVHFTAG